jgi:hypothetical protein
MPEFIQRYGLSVETRCFRRKGHVVALKDTADHGAAFVFVANRLDKSGNKPLIPA